MKLPFKSFLFLLLTFHLSPFTFDLARAEEPILVFSYPPGATSQSPGAGEAGIHRLLEGIYNEAWTFEGYTSAGEIIRAAGGISEAFPWGNKPFIGASILAPDSWTDFFHLWLKPDEFRAASDRLALYVGTGFFREAKGTAGNGSRYEINLREKGFGLVLDVECLAPAWQPPGEGRLVFGKERNKFWDISVPCPRARFAGTIATSRGEEKISGFGYIDHTYSNLRILEFVRRITSYRVHLPEFSLNFLEIEITPKFGGRPIGLLVLADPRGTRSFSEVKVRQEQPARDEQYGYDYPKIFKITAVDGLDRIEIILKVRRIIFGSDGLVNLNRAERAIVKMLGIKPVGYNFANDAEIRLTLGGKTQEFKSPSFHSMLVIK